jgi:serine/threonine-protein kinase HipA
VLAGTGAIPVTHDAWLVKFDLSPDGMHSRMEEAYARMARAAGIDMPETRILETHHAQGVKRHFGIRRFDRAEDERVHHHTLAAMSHMGGGDLDYETLLRVTRVITRDEREVVRAFRRAVFNILASNRDDHGKNHGFIYREREWKLGPAYDLTFSSVQQLPERGLAVAGERRAASTVHLFKLADREGIERSNAKDIIAETQEAVARWPQFAAEAGLDALLTSVIKSALRV